MNALFTALMNIIIAYLSVNAIQYLQKIKEYQLFFYFFILSIQGVWHSDMRNLKKWPELFFYFGQNGTFFVYWRLNNYQKTYNPK